MFRIFRNIHAKSRRYWWLGLWLRLIRAERHFAYMPIPVALRRAIDASRPLLDEALSRPNPLLAMLREKQAKRSVSSS